MIFGRFNERAQKVLVFAQEFARSYRHGYVGTEHILLGILKEDGISKDILNDMGVELEDVENLIEEYEGKGELDLYSNEIPLTPRTKRLLEISLLDQKFKPAT